MKKNFLKIGQVIVVILIIIFGVNFVIGSQIKKVVLKNEKFDEKKEIKTISENNRANGKFFDYYSDSEIRSELQKAGVKNISIEAFIKINNDIKNKTLNFEQAEKKLQEALKLDEKNYLILDAIGQFYSLDNKSSDAVSYYERAVKINPKFRKGYEHMVIALKNFGNEKNAEKMKNEAEQLIKRFPESPVGYYVLFEYYDIYKKNYNEALSVGEKAKELSYKEEPKRYYYETILADEEYEMMLADDESYDDTKGKTEKFGDYFYSNREIGDTLLFSLFDTYLKKDNDKETFDYFFKSYGKMKEYTEFLTKGKFSDERTKKIEDEIKKLNGKYKNTDKKLYEENLKKFKELGL